MNRYFAADDPAWFVAYSTSHWVVLLIFVFLTAALFIWRKGLREGGGSRWVRYGLAGVLGLSELSLNLWYVWQNMYDVKDSLPLELCSLSLYMCFFMLLTRSYWLFQIVYFTGIGGAMQAMLTPAVGYAFPHYRFLEFFAAHIAIILSVLYMVWVEKYRPTWKSIPITMGFLNVMLVIDLGVNKWTGGNYMFLAGKPDTPSLLDVLGPYPWYLLSLEGTAIVLFVLMYLPFAISDRRRKRIAG